MAKENGITAVTKRDKWASQVEFLLSCLGYEIGLGNVWRFSYLVYKNGGAAFLIPYGVMLLCAGIPMFFMELAIGQYTSYGPNIIFQEMSPIFSGLGWGMVSLSLLTSIYYNIILAWSIFYVFASFSEVLPWGNCKNYFNTPECYDPDDAASCRNESLHYYNNSCLNTEDYCGIAGLQAKNLSHCYGVDRNGTSINTNDLLPKMTPSEEYYRNRVLGVSGTSWEDLGSMRWELVGCLALAWLMVGLTIMKGIKSSGKVVYFTATFPYVTFVILFIRGITLEGAYKGIEYYILKTNWTKLTEVEVWNDAATQIFFSMGISFGNLLMLSSYNKFSNNCMRDAIAMGFSNCITSVFLGFVIFSFLGFLANELGVEVGDVATSGSGLAFVVYPAAVNLMPLPQLWSVLFFLMLITVGLDTQFTMVETVLTSLYDQFPSLRTKKALVSLVTCVTTFLLGLSMCLEGGVYMFQLLDTKVAGLALIVMAIFQAVVVQYFYGHKKLLKNIKEMQITMPRFLQMYWTSTWLFITPISLGILLAFGIYYTVPAYWGKYIYPSNIQVLGWFLCATSVVWIPLGAIYVLCKKKDKSFQSLTKATSRFCPAHEREGLTLDEGKVNNVKPVSENLPRYVYHNDGFTDIIEEAFTVDTTKTDKSSVAPPTQL